MAGVVATDKKLHEVVDAGSTLIGNDVDLDAAFDSIINVESIHHLKGFEQVNIAADSRSMGITLSSISQF